MSKKITPCEKLGYKAGDKFEVIEDSVYFKKGEIVSLRAADNSICPFFINEKVVRDGYRKGCAMYLSSVRKISKLKPAKQALADAIHQNGGWRGGGNFAAQDKNASVTFFVDKPWRCELVWESDAFEYVGCFLAKETICNWHQCILSRDEYFTAYPEQVRVEVKNETEHKVDVEMKSESEMTIKVGDWHKSGELPPVGEVCLWIGRKENGDYRDDLRTGDRVEVIAHYKPRSDGPMVAVFAYESRESIGRQTDQSIAKCFSPLRTEREKEIDVMMLECQYAGDSVDKCKKFAIALYDAGYRKEVK